MRKKILDELVAYLKENGAVRILLFGSQATGKAKPESDVDLIVRFNEPKGLFELVRIELEASKRIRKKVDLQTEAAIHPLISDRDYRESKVLVG